MECLKEKNHLNAILRDIESITDTKELTELLWRSITIENPVLFEVLRKQGADLSVTDNDHSTALHMAAAYGCVEIAKTLIDLNIGIHAENDFRKKPVHRIKDIDMLMTFYSSGMDILEKNSEEKTLLDFLNEYMDDHSLEHRTKTFIVQIVQEESMLADPVISPFIKRLRLKHTIF